MPDQQGTRFTYRTVWRWHFYAGLFCIPFVVWLSITGGIYLFKTEIEAWLDQPYERIALSGVRQSGDALIRSALHAVPGSTFLSYQLPVNAQSAVQILLGQGANQYRAYVHPHTAQVVRVIREDQRPMRQLFYLHGELALGDKGSMLVELAASWAVIMILNGLYLWSPQNISQLPGSVSPGLSKRGRAFWKDLHSVTGLWISAFALFLLFSGLPWAKSWGSYLKVFRAVTGAAGAQDWTTGRSSELAANLAVQREIRDASAHTHEGRGLTSEQLHKTPQNFAPIDTMIASVSPLRLAYPALISPPHKSGGPWFARSDAPNRTLRSELTLDPDSGQILTRVDFNQRHWIDRAVGIGVAAHEGQLFGIWNQAISLFTVFGLVLLSISALIMWWRRRPAGVLGAPNALAHSGIPKYLFLPVLILAVYLPLFGLSMVIVFVAERMLFPRMPGMSRWLGLNDSSNRAEQVRLFGGSS